MSDLTRILAENQKEMLKLVAPLNKKQTVHMNVQDPDSEAENLSVARTSTPIKTHTATNPKTTPVNSRNTDINGAPDLQRSFSPRISLFTTFFCSHDCLLDSN